MKPEVLLDGLRIGECPRWHDGRLWFCNWGEDEVVAVDVDGKPEVVLRDPVVKPHSIDFLPDGRMLILPGGDEHKGLLLRREPGGSIVPHADLRSVADDWNEIVLDGAGRIFVNNVGFDFMAFLSGQAEFALGGISVVTPDGAVRQVADGIEFPNGMVVTPDSKTLIVAESMGGRLTAFDIGADGGLANRRVWADGVGPDGITIDAEGAVWTSVEQQDCVRVREGGEILERVDLDRSSFACMLGGPDRRTLFIMAAQWQPENPFGGTPTGQVQTIPVAVSGAGWP